MLCYNAVCDCVACLGKGVKMKKLLAILPCIIILCGCDKTKFYETDIECISPNCTGEECDNLWDKYKSLEINGKTATLQTDDGFIVFKQYTQSASEGAEAVYEDMGIYKNEKDEQPLFLHFVDKDVYSLGTSLNEWYECRKSLE